MGKNKKAKNTKGKKLSVKKETLRKLDPKETEQVAGGTLYKYDYQLVNYDFNVNYSGACGGGIITIGPLPTKNTI